MGDKTFLSEKVTLYGVHELTLHLCMHAYNCVYLGAVHTEDDLIIHDGLSLKFRIKCQHTCLVVTSS